ncbi:MAG: 50S ribosomal protein L25 [Syntrophomonadaceae bacterium]
MEQTTLTATDRQPGKFREQGFIPGVIYGGDVATSQSVKFEYGPVQKLISRHGANARVEIGLGNTRKSGFIKEIQRDAITKKIIHVDIQVVSKGQEIKLNIPILFDNEEQLADRRLQLLVYKPTVEVEGTMASIPESIRIDVGNLEAGESVTVETIEQGHQLKVSDKEDTLYAAIIHQPVEMPAEEPVEEPTKTSVV